MAAYVPAAVQRPKGVERDQFMPGNRMQDVLLNMFKERQGGFAGVPGEKLEVPGTQPKRGSFGAKSLVHSQGLAWGFLDPRWFQKPQGMADVMQRVYEEPYNEHPGKYDPNHEVHGGPAQDPVESDPLGTDPILPPPNSPEPPPRNAGGHWEWGWDPANVGRGTWLWIQDRRNPGGGVGRNPPW